MGDFAIIEEGTMLIIGDKIYCAPKDYDAVKAQYG